MTYKSYLLVSKNDSVGNDIKTKLPGAINRPPTGYIDTITSSGIVRGWAADPDIGDGSTQVHFYLDGPAVLPFTNKIGSLTANTLRTDLLNSIGYGRYSGFSFQIPVENKFYII